MTRARTLSYAAVAVFALALGGSAARADEAARAGNVGVGYAAMLDGPNGLNFVYDGGRWHADAILGFSNSDGGGSELGIAARGWFHLHHTTSADFSIGGGLGFIHQNPPGPGSRDTTDIELGFQIRAFITSNVALGAFGGLAVLAGDGDGVHLGAQPLGDLSLTYYFF